MPAGRSEIDMIQTMTHAQACMLAIQYLKRETSRLSVNAQMVICGYDDSLDCQKDLEEYEKLLAIIRGLEEGCREGV
jgi:hypothetical protein